MAALSLGGCSQVMDIIPGSSATGPAQPDSISEVAPRPLPAQFVVDIVGAMPPTQEWQITPTITTINRRTATYVATGGYYQWSCDANSSGSTEKALSAIQTPAVCSLTRYTESAELCQESVLKIAFPAEYDVTDCLRLDSSRPLARFNWATKSWSLPVGPDAAAQGDLDPSNNVFRRKLSRRFSADEYIVFTVSSVDRCGAAHAVVKTGNDLKYQ